MDGYYAFLAQYAVIIALTRMHNMTGFPSVGPLGAIFTSSSKASEKIA